MLKKLLLTQGRRENRQDHKYQQNKYHAANDGFEPSETIDDLYDQVTAICLSCI